MTSRPIENIELSDFGDLSALIKERIDHEPVLAMATSPSQCLMLKVNDAGQLTGSDGKTVDLESFYEVVVFCEGWQITATRNGKKADVQIITEPEETDGFINQKQQYLVWGKVTAPPKDGWCKLRDPRIGEIDIPYSGEVKKDDLLALKAREIVTRGEHGNAEITGQRLLRIEVYGGDVSGDGAATGGGKQ